MLGVCSAIASRDLDGIFCIYLGTDYDRKKKHVFITGGGSGGGFACVAQFSEKKVMPRLPNEMKKDFSGRKKKSAAKTISRVG